MNQSTTATKTYKELINYNCISTRKLELQNNDLLSTMNNKTILNVYYQYINNFLSSISDPVNHKVKNIQNTKCISFRNEILNEQIFPIGTGNVPLTKEKRIELAKLHTSRKKFSINFMQTIQIFMEESIQREKNIPNLASNIKLRNNRSISFISWIKCIF